MTSEKEFIISNKLGLHARPAASFVRVANSFKAEVWVANEEEEVNGKSIMGLMMLAAGPGSKITVRTEGADAEEAIRGIEALIDAGFNEGS
jgi:phosphocarrier protein HPr